MGSKKERDRVAAGVSGGASLRPKRQPGTIAREPKSRGNDDARGRSGAGLPDEDRRRTRDGNTSGTPRTTVENDE